VARGRPRYAQIVTTANAGTARARAPPPSRSTCGSMLLPRLSEPSRESCARWSTSPQLGAASQNLERTDGTPDAAEFATSPPPFGAMRRATWRC
jgi:hypothetical protein